MNRRETIFINFKLWLLGKFYVTYSTRTTHSGGLVIDVGAEFKPRFWVKWINHNG